VTPRYSLSTARGLASCPDLDAVPDEGLTRRSRFPQRAGAASLAIETPDLDDNQRCVSAPDGRLLAAKSERVRLPNTSPNFRARALSSDLAAIRSTALLGQVACRQQMTDQRFDAHREHTRVRRR
jgi:hypothetical protein